VEDEGGRRRLQIVGVIRDARYRGMREAIPPLVYVPFRALDRKGAPRAIGRGTLIVRASASNPLTLASALRRETPRARPGFRVSNIRTQTEINDVLTIRERLLAMLAVFFAAVALLLACIGLHGVLDYSVLQRRREIGIRMAIGAQAADIARRVFMDALVVVLAGSIFGIILGIASARFVESLLFEVKAKDAGALALPAVTILAVALLAALPATIRAVRIDPVAMLRSD
jgi:ABC-type lipoprotein release transport system permease subunit